MVRTEAFCPSQKEGFPPILSASEGGQSGWNPGGERRGQIRGKGGVNRGRCLWASFMREGVGEREGGEGRLWQVYGLSVLGMSELSPGNSPPQEGPASLTHCAAGERD